jgi:hypothetical protein
MNQVILIMITAAIILALICIHLLALIVTIVAMLCKILLAIMSALRQLHLPGISSLQEQQRMAFIFLVHPAAPLVLLLLVVQHAILDIHFPAEVVF